MVIIILVTLLYTTVISDISFLYFYCAIFINSILRFKFLNLTFTVPIRKLDDGETCKPFKKNTIKSVVVASKVELHF